MSSADDPHDPDATGYEPELPIDVDQTNYVQTPAFPGSGSHPGGSPSAGGDEHSLPRRFGRYELVRRLAKGGMGVVYQAFQLGPDGKPVRPVAVKMILNGAEASGEIIARFRAEAELTSRLDHPYIVPVHEVGEVDGQPFYSMPLIDGGSLHELVKREDRPLPPAEAARLVLAVAGAVEAVH
jgi:serine/threonine-protein kinase